MPTPAVPNQTAIPPKNAVQYGVADLLEQWIPLTTVRAEKEGIKQMRPNDPVFIVRNENIPAKAHTLSSFENESSALDIPLIVKRNVRPRQADKHKLGDRYAHPSQQRRNPSPSI